MSSLIVALGVVALAACSSVTDFDRFHHDEEGDEDGGMDGGGLDAGDGGRVDTGPCTTPTAEECNEADDDCDGDVDEDFDLETDPSSCGMCGHVCQEQPRGAPDCEGGACYHVCDDGFGDCDGDYDTGCETDLTDPDTCGSCDTVCPEGMACSASAGCVDTCPGGETVCGRSCIDTDTSLLHCGACDSPCAERPRSSVACVAGGCEWTCDADSDDCDGVPDNGCETDLTTTTDCGGCGTSCTFANGVPACTAGACELSACNAGFDDCNGMASDGCEADLGTVSTCGACGTPCPTRANASTTCDGTSCGFTCDAGFDDCNMIATDGCEADLGAPATCRDCDTMCGGAAPDCGATGCVSGCTAPAERCSGSCVDTTTSPLHCGGCGMACADPPNSSPTCTSGSCGILCDTGYDDCDATMSGCETSILTTTNCGACGVTCTRSNATATCSTGTCTISMCNTGFGNCDGMDANGCETNTSTSTSHCGMCGNACTVANGTPSCSGGACGVGTCNAGYGDCNLLYSDGCETVLPTWYRDVDGDGFGVGSMTLRGCTRPSGYASAPGDCNDANDTIYPDATETCNALDDDCDGAADEDFDCARGSTQTCTVTCDGTNWTGTETCDATCTWGMCVVDEVCDRMDNDCDGLVDEGLFGVLGTRAIASSSFTNAHGQPYAAATNSSYGVVFLAYEGVEAFASVFIAELDDGLATAPSSIRALTGDNRGKRNLEIIWTGSLFLIVYADVDDRDLKWTFIRPGMTGPTWYPLPPAGDPGTPVVFGLVPLGGDRAGIVYADGVNLSYVVVDGASFTATAPTSLGTAPTTETVTDLSVVAVGSDLGVLIGQRDAVTYSRYSTSGARTDTTGNLMRSGHTFSRPGAPGRALWLVYDGVATAAATFATVDAGGVTRLYRSVFAAAASGIPTTTMHGTSASSHHCLAASLPSSSFAIGVDPVVARRTFTDTAISPPASAGSVVAPTMIGGLFGDMTYVRSHLSGPAAVTVTGFGCTP